MSGATDGREADATSAGPRRSPLVLLLLLFALAISVRSTIAWIRYGLPLEDIFGWRYGAVLALLLIGGLAGLQVLTRLLRGGPSTTGHRALGAAVTIGVATLLVHLVWFQPHRDIVWLGLAGVAAGLFCDSLVVLAHRRSPLPRPLAGLAILSGTLLALFVATEGTLRLISFVYPHPLLLVPGNRAAQELAANRRPPGELHYDTPLNARGYLDQDLDLRDVPRPLATVIGDSFGFCAVPYRYHYTTICEEELGFGELYNMGVVAVGAEAYLALLQDEALALGPDLIVLALFLGNDIPTAPPRPEAGAGSWLDRRELRGFQLVRRLLIRAGERRAHGETPGEPPATPRPEDDLAWLDDPFLEVPTFSEQAFLTIETRRVRQLTSEDIDPRKTLLPVLEEFVAIAGDTPVLFLLIPDEFQVEDELWERLARAQEPGSLERDRPQRILTAAFEERGWDHLDLLPALRAVEPLADGRRHVYHLRDTHFNRRGCEVAGRALAAKLRTIWNERP